MRRILILIGLALVAGGILWPWLRKLGLGRLPGDFVIDREGLRIHLPLMTCLIVSLLLTLAAWLLRR